MNLRGVRHWEALLTLAIVIASGACGGSGPQPAPTVRPIATCVTQAEQRAHGVTLGRVDGDTVKGLVYGSGRTAVVFAAEIDGDVCQWQFNAEDLANRGYQTVVFNWFGLGDADVLAAVATVRSRGAQRVFLVGASKGGTAVLTAAAEAKPPVSGVVSLSGPAGIEGMDALSAVRTLTTPVLFIVGDNDEPFTGDAHTLYEACAAPDKKLVVDHTGNHGVALVDLGVTRMIEDFFTSH